jgi:hypothetical protein
MKNIIYIAMGISLRCWTVAFLVIFCISLISDDVVFKTYIYFPIVFLSIWISIGAFGWPDDALPSSLSINGERLRFTSGIFWRWYILGFVFKNLISFFNATQNSILYELTAFMAIFFAATWAIKSKKYD